MIDPIKEYRAFNHDIKLVLSKHGFEVTDLIGINVIITQKNDKPAIFLRRNTTDTEIIKRVFQAAYHNQPLIIAPQFTNSLQSISTALEKGILYKTNDGYRFTF